MLPAHCSPYGVFSLTGRNGESSATTADPECIRRMTWWFILGGSSGLVYFLAWSLSFYPQPLLNYKRRSTQGLTPDYPKLNVLGFSAYSISVLALLYSPIVRDQYHIRHPASSRPPTNEFDAAFGLHALVLCIITYSQFYPGLWGWEKPAQRQATKVTDGLITGSCAALVIVLMFLLLQPTLGSGGWQELDLVYALQYIKLSLTIFKYLPQAISNARRRSTAGWSIGQVLCDFVGGVSSLTQLLSWCIIWEDWSSLWGDPAKLGLAIISLAFDIVFLVQHYLLYGPREVESTATHESETSPLLGGTEAR